MARTAIGIALAVLAASCTTAEPLDLEDETTRINYSVGHQIGGDFKRQGVALDAEAVVRGIEDALAGGDPQIPEPEMHQMLVELKRRIVAEERVRSTEAELQMQDAGRKFLEANAKAPGVATSGSGLQYRILAEGKGRHPGPRDEVTCRYRGTLIDGHEFDSSGAAPARFRLDGVIKGWTEGLQLIGTGGKIQLFVPPELAYRDRGPLGHRTLVYDIELISVHEGK